MLNFMVYQAKTMGFEEEQERVVKALPDMKYVGKWRYGHGVEKDENGRETAKSSSLELNLELPSSYENWELMRRLMIENGLPILKAKKNKWGREGMTFYSNVSYGGSKSRTYSLYLYRKGVENLRERVRLTMNCRIALGEEIGWDFALIKSVAGYVNAYEEYLKPKPKPKPETETQVEKKLEAKEKLKDEGQTEKAPEKSNLVSIVA